jgi:DNA-binding HxlR family transcriptional regulator
VAEFRYAQFCPLARAAEILGERWTLLVVRDLLLGPRRFSDLRASLPDVSPSVLAERLAKLEERGLVARRRLPPPAPPGAYALTDAGEALRGVVLALGRWGIRYLGPRRPGDHFEPAWLRLGLAMLARAGPTPECVVSLRVADGEREVAFDVAGGPAGTRLGDSLGAPLATLRAAPLTVLGLASGRLDPRAALASGAVALDGDAAALDLFPRLFEPPASEASPHTGAQ